MASIMPLGFFYTEPNSSEQSKTDHQLFPAALDSQSVEMSPTFGLSCDPTVFQFGSNHSNYLSELNTFQTPVCQDTNQYSSRWTSTTPQPSVSLESLSECAWNSVTNSDSARHPPPLEPLATHPMFRHLQSALKTECEAPTGTPSALITATLGSQDSCLPLSERLQILTDQFASLDGQMFQQVSQLHDTFRYHSNELEASRAAALAPVNCNPWLTASINSYYDCQHQALITRVQHSIRLVKDMRKDDPITCSSSTNTNKNCTINANAKKKPSKECSLNPVAIKIMTNYYERNNEHPYPSYETAQILARAGGISIDQVKKWFANRRLRASNTKTLTQIAKRRRAHKRQRSSSFESILLDGMKKSRE